MADHLELHILTPNGPKRQALSVPGVEIPGLLGELGVLPDHEPFVTAVRPGVVRFREGAGSSRIAVGSGFLEITGNGRVVVLVERALESDEIDRGAAEELLRDVTARLAAHHLATTTAEFRSLSEERAWLEAQIRASTG